MLVSLGIVVLLGGVWFVSIQSGGGGIDLGTWDEEIVDLSSEDLESIIEFNETDETTSTTVTMPLLQQPSNIPHGSMPMVRESRSESSMPNVSGIDEHGFGKMKMRISLSPDRRQRPHRADTLYDSPRIPSVHTAGQSMTSDLQHTRISSSPSESTILNRMVSYTRVPLRQSSFHAPHPHHPLTHGTGLGPAFQIGLSPVSPGFAILPLERKKTNAYAGGGDGVSGPGRRKYLIQKMQRRRTVSDGEVPRTGPDLLVQADSRAGEIAVSRDDWVEGPEIETGPDASQEGQDARLTAQPTGHRWRWLTNFLPRWSRKD